MRDTLTAIHDFSLSDFKIKSKNSKKKKKTHKKPTLNFHKLETFLHERHNHPPLSFDSKISILNEEATLLSVERVEKRRKRWYYLIVAIIQKLMNLLSFMKNSETWILKDQLILYWKNTGTSFLLIRKKKSKVSTICWLGKSRRNSEKRMGSIFIFPSFPQVGRKKARKKPIKNNKKNNISPINKVHRLLPGIMQALQQFLLPKTGGDCSTLEWTAALEYLISVDRCWLSSVKQDQILSHWVASVLVETDISSSLVIFDSENTHSYQ